MWTGIGVEIFYSPIWGKVIILITILFIRFIIKGLKQVLEFPTPKLNFSTVKKKIRHCFFSPDKSKSVNGVSASYAAQHIESSINTINIHLDNQSGLCCQD